MCGISGIIKSNDAFLSPLNGIQSMNNGLYHRGPDDEGLVFFEGKRSKPRIFGGQDTPEDVYHSNLTYTPREPFCGTVPEEAIAVLGHRRLSILDLSPAGHQPMCNEDGTVWLVHNGEIYNFYELREELKFLGHRFVSHTDTEVIIHAYEEWGDACLQKFNGMWAFAIYDTRTHILFGARDRFGVKPLYYYRDKSCFAFASEIKALITLPFIKKEMNPRAVFDYLVLEINEPEEEGFFKHIFELLPAHAFRYSVSDHTLTTWKYYTLPIIDEWEPFHPGQCHQYVTTIKDLIFKAIALRLRSDVPVGSCLSGGIDSSSIVCVINELLQQANIQQIGGRQKVFTASYDMEMVDESQWVKIVVENTKTSWHQTFPTASEFFEHLEDLVYTQEIPFGSTSIYAQYRVMKLAREHGIKVLLDGQGGDEVFTGYDSYYGTFFLEMLKHLALKSFLNELANLHNAPIRKTPIFFSIARLFGVNILPTALVAWQRRKNARKKFLHKYCNRDFWGTYQQGVESEKTRTTMTSLNTMLHIFMTECKLSSLLRYEDRNSMRFSIESRTPFADDIKLIESMFQIPSIYKIHNGWSKYLLRRAMSNIVPEEILARKDKVGFATPEYFWLNALKHRLKPYFQSDLQEYLDVKKLLRDWDIIMENQPQNGTTKMWRFVNFAIWKKVYGV